MEKQENTMKFLENGKTKTRDEDEKREREMKKRAGKKEKRGGRQEKERRKGAQIIFPYCHPKAMRSLSEGSPSQKTLNLNRDFWSMESVERPSLSPTLPVAWSKEQDS